MKHDDWLHDQLKNDTFAASFLTQAAKDTEPTVFIAALRHAIDARGLAKVADIDDLSKANLYKSLPHDGQGNPTAKTIFAALRATGLTLAITA